MWFSEPSDTQQEKVVSVQGERSTGGCATSCAIEEKHLDQDEWLNTLDIWATQEWGPTKELDTLLFYAKDSLEWLPVFGTELDDVHYTFLASELRRNWLILKCALSMSLERFVVCWTHHPFISKKSSTWSFLKPRVLDGSKLVERSKE